MSDQVETVEIDQELTEEWSETDPSVVAVMPVIIASKMYADVIVRAVPEDEGGGYAAVITDVPALIGDGETIGEAIFELHRELMVAMCVHGWTVETQEI